MELCKIQFLIFAIWLNIAVNNYIIIATDILKQKAKDFAVYFDINYFMESAG
ncbi:9997_t:CDS:2 [Acaulospora morrowiae]|uniref:9997_t:CDS:1 n=1 Tax=Acaulospora morrowiae TaxID=94023 RepID=A0A9N9F1U6_9GLOM|nr:9997_t:CDS:2 [Acaulospora morrowiae]